MFKLHIAFLKIHNSESMDLMHLRSHAAILEVKWWWNNEKRTSMYGLHTGWANEHPSLDLLTYSNEVMRIKVKPTQSQM